MGRRGVVDATPAAPSVASDGALTGRLSGFASLETPTFVNPF